VKVLSPLIRNGLETAIFDPAIVTAAVIRENINFSVQKGIKYLNITISTI
jgi:hypothetical protein